MSNTEKPYESAKMNFERKNLSLSKFFSRAQNISAETII